MSIIIEQGNKVFLGAKVFNHKLYSGVVFLLEHTPLQPLQPQPQPPPAFFFFQIFLTASITTSKTTNPTIVVEKILLAAKAINSPSFLYNVFQVCFYAFTPLAATLDRFILRAAASL